MAARGQARPGAHLTRGDPIKYGFITTNFDYCGEARLLAELAREAEGAGWDGFFVWDHIQWGGEPTVDPWVALAAMAMTTERIRLGPMITPLPRRHIAKLARETVSLDRLSKGRLILGVGAGAKEHPEYTAFGDFGDPKTRASRLDEGLEVLTALWSGKPVKHAGKFYRAETEGFAPPLQQPRIPIWVAATWPHRKPLARAARWDGLAPIHSGAVEGKLVTPDELAQMIAVTRELRSQDGPFDVAQFGVTSDAEDTAQVGAYAEAGATWWVEGVFTWLMDLDYPRRRIRSGPPRI
jgi:alkanesulfonate monooxygenase SsuD/methylene tetrahydromethanopterin reductase-like flavin-dependent oxidoreductase (luciferase family)